MVDTLAIFTYHDGSPSGSLFSPIVFWGWMLVTWGLWANVRYRYGILMALTYNLWDHLPSPLHRWRFGRISGRVYESLYPSLRSTPATPVGMVAPGSFFADVERHYGDPQFVAVEPLFVGGLIASLAFLHR